MGYSGGSGECESGSCVWWRTDLFEGAVKRLDKMLKKCNLVRNNKQQGEHTRICI